MLPATRTLLDKAVEAASDFKKATGIDCFVIEADGTRYGPGKTNPQFCQCARKLPGKAFGCTKVHKWGSYQANRFGGQYIYFCPLNMLHWSSPLIEDGIMVGALVGGPVLILEPEELLAEITETSAAETIDSPEELLETLSEIPRISPERASSLSRLLRMINLGLSGQSRLQQQEEDLQMQSRVSEYIQEIKNEIDGAASDSGELYPLEKEQLLVTAISSGDKKGAREILNQILGDIFFASGRKIDIIQDRVLELVVLLSRAAMQGGAEISQIFGLNASYLRTVRSFNNVDDLAAWLARVMNRFTDLVFNLRGAGHADAVYKAIRYMKENFRNKISVEDTAASVHLSPTYFSRVFKEETGKTFTQYLTSLRTDYASKLLLNSSMPLVEVAFSSGFEDQSYFNRVFKKGVGVSPGKYRERKGGFLGDSPDIHT